MYTLLYLMQSPKVSSPFVVIGILFVCQDCLRNLPRVSDLTLTRSGRGVMTNLSSAAGLNRLTSLFFGSQSIIKTLLYHWIW